MENRRQLAINKDVIGPQTKEFENTSPNTLPTRHHLSQSSHTRLLNRLLLWSFAEWSRNLTKRTHYTPLLPLFPLPIPQRVFLRTFFNQNFQKNSQSSEFEQWNRRNRRGAWCPAQILREIQIQGSKIVANLGNLSIRLFRPCFRCPFVDIVIVLVVGRPFSLSNSILNKFQINSNLRDQQTHTRSLLHCLCNKDTDGGTVSRDTVKLEMHNFYLVL